MPSSAINPQRVLVIDDDTTMRELLSLLLGVDGHTVITAESGRAALKLIEDLAPSERPTILLTDLQMPGLAGGALVAALRAVSPQAGVIAMSGTKPPAAKLASFDGFLQKPFTAADFAAAVEQGANASTVQAKSRTPGGPDAQTALPMLDENVYAKLTATMPAAQLQQLYAMCLDDAQTRITRMRAAAETGDSGTFTREAHAIKGGCGMLGARELHDLASRMEKGALLCTSLLQDFPIAAQRLRRMLDART